MSRYVAIFALTLVSLYAQTNRGAITATVTDQTQAVVPTAIITITNPGTIKVRKGTENPSMVSVTTCPGCNLSVNGGRPMSTLLMTDGTNNTGVSLARTMVSFSPETVQEFTVLTSAYSAEYGTSGGGVITVTTKSGT